MSLFQVPVNHFPDLCSIQSTTVAILSRERAWVRVRYLLFSLFFPSTVLLSVCASRAPVPLDHRDNSFSRSRSSSVTSIDKETREGITALCFCETMARRSEGGGVQPALWVGTSLGAVLTATLSLPPAGEQRLLQPIIASPSGEPQHRYTSASGNIMGRLKHHRTSAATALDTTSDNRE